MTLTAIPKEMKVVGMTATGAVEEWMMPVPKPGLGQVLIKVAASGVNPVDAKCVSGEVPFGSDRPFVLGCDLSGTVAAVGDGVTKYSVGDAVFGMTAGGTQDPQGTLAEYAIADARMIAKKPTSYTMREAAAVPIVLLTAWEGIVDRAKVKSGDVVLVTGGTGGVGHIVIQIAVAAGAKVYGTGSVAKRDIVERYGGIFVDYHTPAELERIAKEETTNGRGFDVVYETVGGEWIDRAIQLVAPRGYILVINGFSSHMLTLAALKAAAIAFPLPILPFMHPRDGLQDYNGGMLAAALPLMEQGTIRPLVDEQTYHLGKDSVLSAYDYLTKGKNRGKLVVEVAPQ